MNDFVLRGFCENCWQPIFMNELGEPQHSFGIPCGKVICKQAKWCLSAKQMKIVFESDKFEEWAGQENYFELCNDAFTFVVKVLEEHPFLVSKILKETEEKYSKEENK